MRTIIAGSRDSSYGAVCQALEECGWTPTLVISGGARGADHSGESWAHHRKIPVKVINADWGKYGRAAGPIRNRQMAMEADAVVAVWDGKSRGTKNMIELAKGFELKLFIYHREEG